MSDISLEDVERFVGLARRGEGHCDDPPGMHLAFHEAGHVVACQSVGIGVLEVVLGDEQGYVYPAPLSNEDEAALSSSGPEDLSPAQLQMAAKHLVVDHAGFAAGHELVGYPDLDFWIDDETISDEEYEEGEAEAPEQAKIEANSADMMEAADRARRLWPGCESRMLTWAEGEATDTVTENRRAVLAVAGALVELRHLDERQISRIFQTLEPIHQRGTCPYLSDSRRA